MHPPRSHAPYSSAHKSGDGIFLAVVIDGGFADLAGLDADVQIALHVGDIAVLEAEFKPRRGDVRVGVQRKRGAQGEEKQKRENLFHVKSPFLSLVVLGCFG